VLDPHGAVVAGTTVVITDTNGEVQASVPVDMRGVYCATVPPGTYSIGMLARADMHPNRRADVQLQKGREYHIDLFPAFRAGVLLTADGDRRGDDTESLYDRIPVDSTSAMVIRYARKLQTSRGTRYEGPVLVTYDVVSISGRDFVVDAKARELTAEDCVIHLSGRDIPATRAKVNFGGRRISLPGAEEDMRF
jgi:hypothetical protein